jgi:hypothetical protein
MSVGDVRFEDENEDEDDRFQAALRRSVTAERTSSREKGLER